VGTFEATVVVRELTAPFAESSSSVTIRTGVTPPQVRINQPTPGTLFEIGETIPFSGGAEFEGQPVPPSSLSWSVIQLHNQHEHLVNEYPAVTSGSFTPVEHSDDTRYMVCLAASSGPGLTDQKCVTLNSRTTEVTFASQPVGEPITYVNEELEVLVLARSNAFQGIRRRVGFRTTVRRATSATLLGTFSTWSP
jgi:hypothetical protein